MRRASSRRIFSCCVGERSDDEQDGVGAGGAGFENLEGIEDEVLAQAGNGDGCGSEGEILERALEELFVGEHGERGCSGCLERAGQRGWIEVRTDESTRGRGLLQLGDDGRAGGRGTCAGRPRIRAGVCAAALRSRSARSAAARRAVTSMQRMRENLLKLSGHGLCVVEKSWCRRGDSNPHTLASTWT